MIKFLLALLLINFNIEILNAKMSDGKIIYDSENQSMPINFRDVMSLNMDGLNKIHAIASGQFSEDELKNIQEYTKSHYANYKIIVLDLREEYHGFVNGIPISWFSKNNSANYGKKQQNIIQMEKQIFQNLNKTSDIIIYSKDDLESVANNSKTDGKKIRIKNVLTEEDVVKSIFWQYKRLPITDHHPPSKNMIKEITKFINEIPSDTIVYVHCKAGKGRTTTFLAIYDILKNGKNFSFEDILQRQYKIGGANLLDTSHGDFDRSNLKQERIEVLREFYNANYKNSQ